MVVDKYGKNVDKKKYRRNKAGICKVIWLFQVQRIVYIQKAAVQYFLETKGQSLCGVNGQSSGAVASISYDLLTLCLPGSYTDLVTLHRSPVQQSRHLSEEGFRWQHLLEFRASATKHFYDPIGYTRNTHYVSILVCPLFILIKNGQCILKIFQTIPSRC